jgi:hypothetical protein
VLDLSLAALRSVLLGMNSSWFLKSAKLSGILQVVALKSACIILLALPAGCVNKIQPFVSREVISAPYHLTSYKASVPDILVLPQAENTLLNRTSFSVKLYTFFPSFTSNLHNERAVLSRYRYAFPP